jgi:hypothetical protein
MLMERLDRSLSWSARAGHQPCAPMSVRLLADLGIAPTPVEAILPDYGR